MNPLPPEPMSWSRPRWWWTIGGLLAAQVLLVFLFSNRAPISVRPLSRTPVFRLVAATPAEEHVREVLAVRDPTLFALVNARGFSGAAWLQAPPAEYRPAPWTEPPRLLSLEASALGRAFAQFIQTNLVATESLAGQSEPLVIPPRILQELAATQSVVQMEGDLARRPLRFLPSLPLQQHNDILTNSIVQIGVNPSGYPESARLLSGSGSKKADQEALAIAKAARFAPLPGLPASGTVAGADLTWGKLFFQWFTIELAPTNKPNVKP